jgi:hypothetical protein
MSVIVRVRVNAKRLASHYTKNEATGKSNVNTTIDMNTVYTNDPKDPNYIFSAMSGGTKFELSTINQEAADQFELEGEYECVFTRVK